MERAEMLRILVAGAVSGTAGYLAYPRAGLAASLVVVFTVALAVYLFSSKKRAWDSLGRLTNPFWTAVLGFLAGYSYASLQHPGEALLYGVGAALLSGALGIFLHRYWNIGG